MERMLLVYTTFPDAPTALSVGEALVRARLAACVNVLPDMQSVYSWNGAVERATEVVAILKSREGLAEALGAALKQRHPYETPIILHLPVIDADPDTAAWIVAETRAHSDEVDAGSSKECAAKQDLRDADLMQSGRIRL